MRTAPAVSIAVGAEPRWRFTLTALAASALLTGFGWTFWQLLASTRSEPWPQIAAALASLALTACGAGECWRLRTPLVARLEWNGQDWRATDQLGLASIGHVAAAIDLGGWMLLRFTAAAAGRFSPAIWIPVSERQLPAQWHALRCAATARHGR